MNVDYTEFSIHQLSSWSELQIDNQRKLIWKLIEEMSAVDNSRQELFKLMKECEHEKWIIEYFINELHQQDNDNTEKRIILSILSNLCLNEDYWFPIIKEYLPLETLLHDIKECEFTNNGGMTLLNRLSIDSSVRTFIATNALPILLKLFNPNVPQNSVDCKLAVVRILNECMSQSECFAILTQDNILLLGVMRSLCGPEDNVSDEQRLVLPECIRYLSGSPSTMRETSSDVIIQLLQILLKFASLAQLRERMRQVGVDIIIYQFISSPASSQTVVQTLSQTVLRLIACTLVLDRAMLSGDPPPRSCRAMFKWIREYNQRVRLRTSLDDKSYSLNTENISGEHGKFLENETLIVSRVNSSDVDKTVNGNMNHPPASQSYVEQSDNRNASLSDDLMAEKVNNTWFQPPLIIIESASLDSRIVVNSYISSNEVVQLRGAQSTESFDEGLKRVEVTSPRKCLDISQSNGVSQFYINTECINAFSYVNEIHETCVFIDLCNNNIYPETVNLLPIEIDIQEMGLILTKPISTPTLNHFVMAVSTKVLINSPSILCRNASIETDIETCHNSPIDIFEELSLQIDCDEESNEDKSFSLSTTSDKHSGTVANGIFMNLSDLSLKCQSPVIGATSSSVQCVCENPNLNQKSQSHSPSTMRSSVPIITFDSFGNLQQEANDPSEVLKKYFDIPSCCNTSSSSPKSSGILSRISLQGMQPLSTESYQISQYSTNPSIFQNNCRFLTTSHRNSSNECHQNDPNRRSLTRPYLSGSLSSQSNQPNYSSSSSSSPLQQMALHRPPFIPPVTKRPRRK